MTRLVIASLFLILLAIIELLPLSVRSNRYRNLQPRPLFCRSMENDRGGVFWWPTVHIDNEHNRVYIEHEHNLVAIIIAGDHRDALPFKALHQDHIVLQTATGITTVHVATNRLIVVSKDNRQLEVPIAPGVSKRIENAILQCEPDVLKVGLQFLSGDAMKQFSDFVGLRVPRGE